MVHIYSRPSSNGNRKFPMRANKATTPGVGDMC